MIAFEALSAQHGDCLLVHDGGAPPSFLWLIDGGPAGVLHASLLPRLAELAEAGKPARVTWGMISHIDDDHINGMETLLDDLVTATGSGGSRALTIARFWFNSFSALVGGSVPQAAGAEATPQDIAAGLPPGLLGGDSHADAVLQSVGQGENVSASLRSLQLTKNLPFDGLVEAPSVLDLPINTAKITVLGPRKNRVEALRKAWAKAVGEPTKAAREAALQDLFLPARSLDKSVPNLSSIVVLAEFPSGSSILLTGDARGDDIVATWTEMNGGQAPKKPISILKAPHHGSERGFTAAFLDTFPARHYVFSADGRFDNPDARVVEAVVATQDKREITLHFTNDDIKWSKPYKMDTTGVVVETLDALIAELKKRPGTKATYASRAKDALSLRIDLP